MGILKTIRRSLFGSNWGPEAVKIPSKWRKAGGGRVRVLVIDSGVPHGWEKREINKNFVYNEEICDKNGHSTSVFGIIRDFSPKSEIVCYKAIDRDGHSDGCMTVLAALRAAVVDGGFAVVNISLAAYRGASKLHGSIQELAAAGALVIAGAGNDPAKGLAYPARWEEVLAVGACNRKGNAAPFSAPGADVLMPGVDIRVDWLHGARRIVSGTSVAAAAASGLAALAMSAGLDAQEAREAIARMRGGAA